MRNPPGFERYACACALVCLLLTAPGGVLGKEKTGTAIPIPDGVTEFEILPAVLAEIAETSDPRVANGLERPFGSTHLLIDSPASLDHDDLRELTRDATSILVPVLPSSMDIHAASRCIADLLLVAKVDRRDRKLAVVANRTRKNTKSFATLMRFLDSLGIPIVAVLRDTQNFVHSAEQGIGVCEMPPSRVKPDVEQLEKIVAWLDTWPQRRRDSNSTTAINKRPSAARALLQRAQLGSA